MKNTKFLAFFTAAFLCLFSACHRPHAIMPEKIIIDTVPAPPISRLTILEKDLKILETQQLAKDMEIKIDEQEMSLCLYAYTNPSAKNIDKQIAKEKVEACRQVLKKDSTEKLTLANKRVALEKTIDSLKQGSIPQ